VIELNSKVLKRKQAVYIVSFIFE